MAAHLLCQCGNDFVMPENRSGVPVICPRCGRIQTEPYRFTKQSVPFNQNVPSSNALNAAGTTGVQTKFASTKNVNQHQQESGSPQTEEEFDIDDDAADTEILVPKSPIQEGKPAAPDETQISSAAHQHDTAKHSPVQNTTPEQQENRFANPAAKRSPNPGSGTGSSSGMRSGIANLDLSERVMGTISKSSAPMSVSAGSHSHKNYGIHRILRTHQKGGMGRILIAFDPFLKRDVALKELHPEVSEDLSIVRRFIGEAEITAQLEHPGVIPIHTLNRDREGLPYYTMKFIKGVTYQEAIKSYHRNPTKQDLLNLIRRLVSICKTIGFAHTKGVIHRDLKPANIMLGEHGETLVMDWGLAKPIGALRQGEDDSSFASPEIEHHADQARAELTVVGAVVGTPAFMSPEQASPESNIVGPLSDIFSLGTILYYLLTGQTAFSGRSTQEVLGKVRAASPTPPSEIKPNVPAGLEAVCAKAMAKNPADRYQTAAEMDADLCRWLDDEPVLAQKESFAGRLVRWIDKHRMFVIAVPFLIILLIVFAQIGIYLDRSNHIRLENETIQTILDTAVDLTNYPSVKFTGSQGLTVKHEVRRMTGGEMISCSCEQVPELGHAVVTITAPGNGSWNLSKRESFQFSVYEEIEKKQTEKDAPLNTLKIRMGRGSSYFEYTPKPSWWNDRKIRNWQSFSVPLNKQDSWEMTSFGYPDKNDIGWVEIHFDVKTPVNFQIDNISFSENE